MRRIATIQAERERVKVKLLSAHGQKRRDLERKLAALNAEENIAQEVARNAAARGGKK